MKHVVCDIAVIGSGPAGASAALFLARRGYDVRLIDRTDFPRSKPCGEYLTPGAVNLLRDEIGVGELLRERGARTLRREAVIAHNSRSFTGETNALACPRTVTDAVLRQAAIDAGAQAQTLNARLILRENGQIVGIQGTDTEGVGVEIRASVTMGADGTRSLLAREMGVVRPISRLQKIALVAHYKGCDTRDDAVTMHLPKDNSDACCGVGPACGPQGTRNVNIVVPQSEARKMAGRRKAYFEERLRGSFPAVWEQFGALPGAGAIQSVGCFGHRATRTVEDGAVLVGDAAMFVHPFTGEGVYFALRGGQLAAQAIDLALCRGDQSLLTGYELARRRELLPRYRLCDAVQRIVHSPQAMAWAGERLRRSSGLTTAILRAIGDLTPPSELFTLPTWKLALSSL